MYTKNSVIYLKKMSITIITYQTVNTPLLHLVDIIKDRKDVETPKKKQFHEAEVNKSVCREV